MPGLSDEQILFFAEQGYLLVEDVISAVDFQPLIHELNETVENSGDITVPEGTKISWELEALDFLLQQIVSSM